MSFIRRQPSLRSLVNSQAAAAVIGTNQADHVSSVSNDLCPLSEVPAEVDICLSQAAVFPVLLVELIVSSVRLRRSNNDPSPLSISGAFVLLCHSPEANSLSLCINNSCSSSSCHLLSVSKSNAESSLVQVIRTFHILSLSPARRIPRVT